MDKSYIKNGNNAPNGDFSNQNIAFHIPASTSIAYLDLQMFATIVCMIPAGKLTTTEAISEMWAKRKGKRHCELADGVLPYGKDFAFTPADVTRVDTILDFASLPNVDESNFIPYWRLISTRGHLIDFGYAGLWTKERQKEMLEHEGHTIIKMANGNRSYKVQNYKNALLDLNSLIIKE